MIPTRNVKAKSLISPPPKIIERQRRQEHRSGSDNRSAQGLIERLIDEFLERAANAEFQIFANTIEDHDRIVDREADDGQNGGDGGAR